MSSIHFRAVIVIAAVFSAAILSSLHGLDASAASCPSTRGYCSSSEGYGNAYAPRQACANGGPNYYGAMWFNNTGNNSTNDRNGYYANSVYISSGASSVSVKLRGSVLACNTWGPNRGVWASEIQPQGSHGYRLTNLSSRSLYRGHLSGAYGQWSSKGSSISAKLNVSGLATNNIGRTDSQTITISLWRCFSYDGRTRAGSCYAQPVVVTVVREARPNKWTIDGRSYVKKNSTATSARRTGVNAVTATPGDTLRWDHDLRNRGPNNMDRNVRIDVNRQSRSLATGSQLSYTSNPSGQSGRGNRNVLFYQRYNIAHTVSQSDVGRKLCQRVSWNDAAWNNTGWGRSSYACANVPYNYRLIPRITIPTDDAVAEDGQASVDVTGTITNNGPTKSHTNIRYRITQLEYPAGMSNPPKKTGGNRISSGTPCSFFTQESACRTLESGTRSGGFSYGGSGSSASYDAVSDINHKPVGTKVCYAISVQRNSSRSDNGTQWRHSDLVCMTIGKRPKVQVHGGSVQVGRVFTGESQPADPSNVNTSVTTLQGVRVVPSENDLNERLRRTQRHWYFGSCAHMDFGDSGRSVGVFKTTSCAAGNEGTTVATDQYGSAQFFTDGLNIYRPNGSVMANGSGVGSTSTTTQAAAVFPITNDRWVVIANSSETSGTGGPGHLLYSIVDMSANGGAGSVLSGQKRRNFGPTNNVLGEALSIAPRINASGDEIGYWIVTSLAGTRTVRTYYVPENWSGGAVTHTDRTIGSAVSSGNRGFGAINFNSDYSRAVLASSINNAGRHGGDSVRLLSFSQRTGAFSELSNWSLGQMVYSADFSPSGDWVYVTSLYNSTTTDLTGYGNVYRYKISGQEGSSTAIRDSVQRLAHFGSGTEMRDCRGVANGGGHVKRGPDGRMYVANLGCSRIGVVNNPDAATLSSVGWQPSGRGLASGSSSTYGLPQTAVALKKDTLPPQFAARTFGSWSEYGIYAPGHIIGMASNSGLNPNRAESNQSAWSRLTFTAPSAADYGYYTSSNSTLPNIEAAFPTVGLPSSSRLANNSSMTPRQLAGVASTSSSRSGRVVTVNGGVGSRLTIRPGSLTAGQWAVINAPNTDVTIAGSGDITYANGTYSQARDIPQLIIIARNITINSTVSRVDAWLVAKNTISTCNQAGTALSLGNASESAYRTSASFRLTADTCRNRLRVNGPVITDKLFLRRTFGAERATSSSPNRPGVPAEVFNLRPDAYIWANHHMTSSKIYRTTNVQEVPPRY